MASWVLMVYSRREMTRMTRAMRRSRTSLNMRTTREALESLASCAVLPVELPLSRTYSRGKAEMMSIQNHP